MSDMTVTIRDNTSHPKLVDVLGRTPFMVPGFPDQLFVKLSEEDSKASGKTVFCVKSRQLATIAAQDRVVPVDIENVGVTKR